MKTRNIVSNLMLLLVFALTACGGAVPDAMMDKPTHDAMMEKGTAAPDAMMPKDASATPEAIMESPAWFGASFTDVNTGQTFTINDFKGKVVLVETMAVWCPKCYTQQEHIKSLRDFVGERDDFVSISLDIDPNEDASILQSYLQQTGFAWRYAIAQPDVAREIAQLYGDQFLNPPSTPILIVDRKGAAHSLPFGIKSAEDLLDHVQPFLDESV